ncbi:short-chain dehydrogenase [Novosphingobium barchaimii LL02]|uniref:Short-chain dehydrogenase n=1 Tax=Novosphingobium barchaimii LL02 TaxID=1114963 RepID=A0A0J7Y9S3_9SPHN|nr:SDR family oxidoreductase [Novosphingobium barchaimii]KMS60367.1 short-chain dehydrogenase [Novosphingobium barchaimii LL02]
MANVAITGAARGIAFELAKQHLERGDRVFALVRSAGGADALNDLAASSGGKVTVHTMDVGDSASVKSGAASTGDDPIDILYNVAGVVGKAEADFENIDWDDFDQSIEIMLKGPLRVLSAFLPRLGEGSKVINFSSQLGASTWPYGGYWGYAAAKAGLNRMMRSIAIDLKDRGIVVGVIHPGYVSTDMSGPGADITPQDSASSIIALTDGWGIEDTGEFYKWNGEKHDW